MGTDGPPPSHTTPKKAHATSDPQHGFRIPSQLHLGETPRTRKSTPQVSGDEFAMNATRDGVAADLGPAVPEVEYEFFERHLLPPLPSSIDIDTVLALLEADQIIVNGRWQQFPIDPWKNAVGDAKNERLTENKVFAALVPLVDEIVRRSGASDAAKKILAFKCLPDYTPPCCFEKKKGRPDGFFVFDEAECPDKPYWCDIVTPAEFKLRDRRPDLQDDIKKICWNMHQVMREDPRRRFVFGFTIENTQMRVWMLNRSDVVVSEPFNFITDHKKFLHFFLSQTYASLHQLGIDTTMKVIQGPSSGELIYNISVHDAKSPNSEPIVFRTDGLINDDGAKSPLGRGTRIWRVKRLVDGEPDGSARGRVLKDSWVDEDRDREGEILEQILNTPGLDDPVVQKALAELFLTHVVSGDVVIDGKPDSTRDFLDGVTDIPAERVFPLTVPSDHKPSHKDDQDAPLIVPASDSERAEILKYSKKRHYRIVFVQECEPLSEQTSLHKVFECLWDITNRLNFLHLLGWVHRDISPGNILYIRETGKWVLSDVEYAKKLDNHDSHGIRTGTANFMAVEVDQGTYLFRASTPKPPPPPPSQRLEDIIKQIVTSLGSKPPSQEYGEHQTLQQANSPNSTTRETFRYNPTHDLESLFWIALYFVINKEAQPAALSGWSTSGNMPASNTPDHRSHPSPEAPSSHYKLNSKQLAFAKEVFYDRGERVVVLLSEDRLEQYFKERPTLLPEIGSSLCELRAHLHGNYITIEKPGYQIDRSVCQNTDLYTAFKACFEKIMNKTAGEDIIVSPLLPDLDTGGVLPSASRSRSTTALLVKFNDTMKRKAAYEAGRTSAPPFSKKWKPSDASESNVFE